MEMPDYQTFVAALEEKGGQPDKAFAALEAMTRDLIGVKLFTVMTADTDRHLSERVYSSMPDVYPVSGTKPYNETHWSEITLVNKQTFVANTIGAIAEVFDDHPLILSLGLESVINVPIIVNGAVIGTINCLHEEGYFTEERVKAADQLKLPAAACMMLHERLKGEMRS
jgi:GAF domain-containing protein